MDKFDITKIKRPYYREGDSDEEFQDYVTRKRDDAYYLAIVGAVGKLDSEYLDENVGYSVFFSESEKKYLRQVAKINFLPLALKRLEKMVNDRANTYSSLITEIYRGGDFGAWTGIHQILEFYDSNSKTPEDRISAETLRMKERLLAITEAAHKKSKIMKRNIDKEIKEML